ncbi:MAG: hypothetical protein FJ086_10495 [Deltaproteobacteria bacterium]|nr:hypothetical protein [Deltaproteobacteria bacterium]
MATDPQNVPPGSLRQQVLQASKRFKATWAEMGKLLVRVRDDGAWKGWGFESFESYCSKELHLRKATVEKLTRSFSFLARHEPRVMEAEDFQERVPAFEVVEVLAEAEQRGQLSEAEYTAVRDSIWDPARPAAELKRELVERFPRPPPPEDLTLRRFAAAARKLAGELQASGAVPGGVLQRASELAEELEALAGAGRAKGRAASGG